MIDAGAEYRLVAEVPGAKREGLEVSPGPVAGTLIIKLETRPMGEGQRLLRAERGALDGRVRYERIVPVAWDADTASSKTTLEDGLLTVIVSKRTGPPPREPSKRDVV